MTGLYIAAGVVVLLVLWVVVSYNGLVRNKTMVEEAYAGMDVSMKKRYDLVPNLVDSVKGYVKHERQTLEAVTDMRVKAMNSSGAEEKAANEQAFEKGIHKLLAVAENYPELKANEQFLDLQEKLSVVEDDIMNSRKYYNGSVREYNLLTKTMPAALIAKLFGFAALPYFEITDSTEREAVKVEF